MPSVLRDSQRFSFNGDMFIHFNGIIMNGNLEAESSFKSHRGTCILRGMFSVSNLLSALAVLLIRHCII